MGVLAFLSLLAVLASGLLCLKFSKAHEGGFQRRGPLRAFRLALAVSSALLLFSLWSLGAIHLWSAFLLLCMGCLVWALLKCSAGDGKGWGRKLAASAIFVALLGTTWLFLKEAGVFGSDPRKGLPELHLDKYEAARAYVLGCKLAALHPGAKALLITGWSSGNESFVKAQRESLEKGFDGKVEIVAQETFPVERTKDRMERWLISGKVGHKQFEDAILRHKDCRLVISMIGLPPNPGRMGVWKWNEVARPDIALLDGELKQLWGLLRSGCISAMASYRPGWTYSSVQPEDLQKAFEQRYILVTKENAQDCFAKYRNANF